jgi:hypothetical protein
MRYQGVEEMVDRYVFVKLLDDEVPGRATIAAHLRAALAAAVGGDATVTVGVPADASAARWDLSIVLRAPDLATWTRLAATPAVTAVLDAWLPDRAAVVKAWTFATE